MHVCACMYVRKCICVPLLRIGYYMYVRVCVSNAEAYALVKGAQEGAWDEYQVRYVCVCMYVFA